MQNPSTTAPSSPSPLTITTPAVTSTRRSSSSNNLMPLLFPHSTSNPLHLEKHSSSHPTTQQPAIIVTTQRPLLTSTTVLIIDHIVSILSLALVFLMFYYLMSSIGFLGDAPSTPYYYVDAATYGIGKNILFSQFCSL